VTATGAGVKRWAGPLLIAGALLAGLALRYAVRAHSTPDTFYYLMPWYWFVRRHSVAASLGASFTNYTPFYSYVLLAAERLGRAVAPVTLMKAISAVFELGCAVMAGATVRAAGGKPPAAAAAFAGVWLAPTVIFNGALWGQADSLWAFFTLVSIWFFVRGRNGVPAFAAAFAVKAQGVFLGPFVLGMLTRRKIGWAWLAVIPAVYIGLALPVVIAGRPIGDVLAVYLSQAERFGDLSRNAANLWMLAPTLAYGVGAVAGLVLAAAAGLALAVLVARSRRDDGEAVLLAACASLLIMPYLLPKMHDRYFYGFELVAIALACVNPRYLVVALISQVDGVLSYLPYERTVPPGVVTPAVLCNGALAIFILFELLKPAPNGRFAWAHCAAWAAACAASFAALLALGPSRPLPRLDVVLGAVVALTGVLFILATRRSGQARPAPSPAAPPGS
jgi:Gpi18-like mannosyltransferase